MTGRRSLARIFRTPVVVACVVAFGLISALLGDGVWDQASWIALAVPLAIIVFYMGKRATSRQA